MLELVDEGVVREFESIAEGDSHGRHGRPRGSAERNGNKGIKPGPPASYISTWYSRSPSSSEFLPLGPREGDSHF